jgi:hypothetical protein
MQVLAIEPNFFLCVSLCLLRVLCVMDFNFQNRKEHRGNYRRRLQSVTNPPCWPQALEKKQAVTGEFKSMQVLAIEPYLLSLWPSVSSSCSLCCGFQFSKPQRTQGKYRRRLQSVTNLCVGRRPSKRNKQQQANLKACRFLQ